MRRFPLLTQLYILAVIAAGIVVLLISLPQHVSNEELILFATLAVSGVLAGSYPLPLVYSHLRIDLTGGILLMAVFLADPPLACLLAALVSVVSGIALRRRPWNLAFNASAEVLGIGMAAMLYRGFAEPITGSLPLDSGSNIMALYLSASGYWLLDSGLVTVLAAARNQEPFLRTYLSNWKEVYLQCILLTLMAVLGSAAWHQGAVYAFLLFVPTAAIYQWLSITKLKQEQVIHAIEIIAEVLDRRRAVTFQHSRRVSEHAVKMGKQLGLSYADLEVLRRAALIHDIGKLGVEDPWEELAPVDGRMTDYQFYNLKQHSLLGAMIAREIPAFEEGEDPIAYHHDWFDGSHVSRNHSGQEIPLGARIISVADSYDRLCMANGEATLTYDPMAVEQLRTMGDRELDPALLAVFLEILEAERLPEPLPARHPHPIPTA